MTFILSEHIEVTSSPYHVQCYRRKEYKNILRKQEENFSTVLDYWQIKKRISILIISSKISYMMLKQQISVQFI